MSAKMSCVPNVIVIGVLSVTLILSFLIINVYGRCCSVWDDAFWDGDISKA